MIVITTPTGNIGQKLLQHLVDAGEPVRVIVRDAARIPQVTRKRIEVVEGSHGDADVVNKAFAGADSVFWVAPPDFRTPSVEAVYLEFPRAACEAFRSQGVKRVVAVSALGRGTPFAKNAGLVTASLAMEEMITATGVDFRALALPSFMDNLLRQAEPIRNLGAFFLPIDGARKAPTCSTGDIAAVAARLLTDGSWSGQASVPVLGPEDLSFDEMAAIMSEVLGRPIRFQQVSDEAYKERMLAAGASEAMAEGVRAMWAAKNQGLDNGETRTAENSSPTSFRQWCEDVLKPAVSG
jgi:uncharacterized protein YbjT (DUF2867 family)